jgi:hypothetical protein
LRAEILGRVPVGRPLSVSLDGVTDLRLEMGRGRSISGRLLDDQGRPVSGKEVFALGADGFERAVTSDDGRFRLEGLGQGPYAVSAGSALAGFALRTVQPGPNPVTLALRPGGRISLRVVSADGRPAPHALASVLSVDGERIDPSLCAAPPTDDAGITTLGVPAGEVVLAVRAETGAALRRATVRAADSLSLEVRLERLEDR